MGRKSTVSFQYIEEEIFTKFSLWDPRHQRPSNPNLVAYLSAFPFRQPQSNKHRLSDEEFRAIHGEEEFNSLLQQRIEQKKRWGYRLLAEEEQFLEKHPELV